MAKPMHLHKKIITTTCIGTILEWAEFTFYAYIALIISQVFFPQMEKKSGLLASFGIFAIGYLMRPIGAILFGHIGDLLGRQRSLQWAMCLMGISTFCIGILPGYNAIGHWAPTLLIVFRCIQGLAVSGEFNGSSIFLMEHSDENPYLVASLTGWAAAIGMMIGSLSALLISLPGTPHWAWRIPFLLGAFIGLLGYYIRGSLKETPAFLREKNKKMPTKVPFLLALKSHHKDILRSSILCATLGIYIYIANVFYATYLVESSSFLPSQAKLTVSLGSLLTIIFFPWAAKKADQHGGKKIMRYGLLLMMISAPLIFLAPLSHSFIIVLMVQIFYALSDALFCAPLFLAINTLFPVNVRYTSTSFSWNASIACLGGTAPLVSAWLQTTTSLKIAPAFYIIIAALVALLTLQSSLETKQQDRLKPPQFV